MSSIDKGDFCFRGGDVQILVKGEGDTVIRGLVYSQVLCLASEIWGKFIYPPFPHINSPTKKSSTGVSTTSTKDDGRIYSARKKNDIQREIIAEIDFTDDDPEALLILLKIAHHRIKTIPKELSRETLFNIAGLVEQYQVLDLVKPYISTWLTEIWDNIPKWINQGLEKTLFIAYVFGQQQEFINISSTIVMHITVESNETLFFSSKHVGGEVALDLLPPGLQDNMRVARGAAKAAIVKFIDRIVTYIRKLDREESEDQSDDGINGVVFNEAGFVSDLFKEALKPLETGMFNGTLRRTFHRVSQVLQRMFNSAYQYYYRAVYKSFHELRMELLKEVEAEIAKALLTEDLKAHMDRAKEQLEWA
ncbi:hypothetical protein HYFRA_00004665 [Hymenoscyphus fraxineus]|uniref:Uncharacterized protein n=1 Tax=Hymenoscyphus fraxineus TaxID=746836 RepID=A0A9N9PT22_9HELO|nr:hypothetical protein HYFRA_00004665 [Hymenoscyphus fraxineus]